MAYISGTALEDHLSLTYDMVQADGLLMAQKLVAAQSHIERLLGYRLAERFVDPDETPGEDETRAEFPADLREAILQLTAWWFENREAAGPAMQEVPFGVREIINEHREFTF